MFKLLINTPPNHYSATFTKTLRLAFLLLQQPHHLLVAIQAVDGVREDPFGDTRIGQFAMREGLDAQLEMPAVAVDAGHQEALLPSTRSSLILAASTGDLVLAPRDAGPADQGRPFEGEHLHRAEAGLGIAGRFKDRGRAFPPVLARSSSEVFRVLTYVGAP